MIELFPSRAVAFSLLGWEIHWYGLLYLAAFIVAWFLLPRLQRFRSLTLTSDDWSGLLSWAVIGVIAGGRLGYVFFYAPAYFLQHPLEIVAVWKGGMSSHGGMIGVLVTLLWATRSRSRSDVWAIADTIVVPAALGLALGRIGNFINLEVYGTITAMPWGIEIPDAEGLRHPTQLYAVVKDLLIALACYWHLGIPRARYGRTLALFFFLYGLLRFLLEYLREQPYGVWDLGWSVITPGQLLTVPLLVAGIWLWIARGRVS